MSDRKTKTLIHTHLGLGDHVICNGLVRELYNESEDTYLVCHGHNLVSVSALFSDLKLNYVDVATGDLVNYDKIHRIGHERCIQREGEWERSFYSQINLDYSKRFSQFYIKRNYEKELLLYNKLNPSNEKYDLICDAGSWGGKVTNFKEINNKRIYLSKVTDNFFDWIYTIENAENIHSCITSLLCLLDHVQIKNPVTIYDDGRLWYTPVNYKYDRVKTVMTKP